MKLNEELVRKFHEGKFAIKYDGVNIQLLRAITKDNSVTGCQEYYYANGVGTASPKGVVCVPIKYFLIPSWSFTIDGRSPNEFIGFDALSDLRKQMELAQLADARLNKSPKVEWQPKYGEEVEVSDDCSSWGIAFFIGNNPKCKVHNVIAANEEGSVCGWQYVRPLTKTITRAEAEKQLGLKITD